MNYSHVHYCKADELQMSNNSLIFVITSPDHAVAEVPEVSFQK
jgi:Rps23 Pro-64 3,4-dihydroxylase Tpa1-like proline 4-hydroxylase